MNYDLIYKDKIEALQVELLSVKNELIKQTEEMEKRAAELLIANRELIFENEEKEKRAVELLIANKELISQSEEKEKRAMELSIANEEKADRAAELAIADKELIFQSREKADRAAELAIADKELIFQTREKADRATELIKANEELVFQNSEKDKRAAELGIANIELAFQSEEKGKRATELSNANREIKDLNDDLEIRVKHRTAQFEAANTELESLSYSISHDLKAPVRHIIGYVSLLSKKYWEILPDDGRHYLDTITGAANNMGELIDGLLQFSRIGRIEINQRLVNMNEIVDIMIQPIREQDLEHRIEFIIDSLPSAYGDIEMIKSVWSNLIENAVKFTSKKEIARIAIGADETNDEIVYYIKDNGAGFDMQYAAKLFTVFQRLHSREDYEGTGVRLATVKRTINRHGGRTWAISAVDEGATFYFSLNQPEGKE